MVDYVNSESVSPANGTDDCEACPKFWIAAYTKPRSEKKTASELSKLGIETYVATQIQLRQWSDRKKNIEVVVVPMIVFANINEDQIKMILHHSNILRIISRPGEKSAARIPAEQIEKLKFILGQTDTPVFYDSSVIFERDSVRVVRGPLMGLVGQVEYCKDGLAELIIKIDLLGGARMKIDKSEIELIK